MTQILKFNTYSMPDETILAVSTGRDELLYDITDVVENNLSGESANQHILITAQRGMGKSFFLRLVEIEVGRMGREENLPVVFARLPEEQRNITHPSTLIQEIARLIEGRPAARAMPKWSDDDSESWGRVQEALDRALDDKFGAGKGLVVVGVENFDELLKTAFAKSADEARLRKVMAENRRVMLLATNLLHSTNTADREYDRPLFHAFRRVSLEGWSETDYEDYLKRRFRHEKKPDHKRLVSRLRPKIKAVAAFTNGAPRIAVMLADFLMENDAVSAAAAMEGLIDELAPYYQDLERRIPPNSRALFDALIRGGEPATQSQLAERVGAAQNRIAEAFKWLTVQDYIIEDKNRKKGRARYFRAADRLFAQYYRRRHLEDAGGPRPLHCMTELMESLYSIPEHFAQAHVLFERGERAPEAAFFTDLAAKMAGLQADDLSDDERRELAKMLGGKILTEDDFKDDEEVKAALDKILKLLASIPKGRKHIDPADMAEIICDSYQVGWIPKIKFARNLIVAKDRTRLWRQIESKIIAESTPDTPNSFGEMQLKKYGTWLAHNAGPKCFATLSKKYDKVSDDVDKITAKMNDESLRQLGEIIARESKDFSVSPILGAAFGRAFNNAENFSAQAFDNFVEIVLSTGNDAGFLEIKMEVLKSIAFKEIKKENFNKAGQIFSRMQEIAKESEHADIVSMIAVVTFMRHSQTEVLWRWVNEHASLPGAQAGFSSWLGGLFKNNKVEFVNEVTQWLADCKIHMGDKAALFSAAPVLFLAAALRNKAKLKPSVNRMLRLYMTAFEDEAPTVTGVIAEALSHDLFNIDGLKTGNIKNPDEEIMYKNLLKFYGDAVGPMGKFLLAFKE